MVESATLHTLASLPLGASGVVDRIDASPEVAHRLMHMGVWAGETVRVVHQTPLGGPLEIEVMGYRLTIRREDARSVILQ